MAKLSDKEGGPELGFQVPGCGQVKRGKGGVSRAVAKLREEKGRPDILKCILNGALGGPGVN